MVKNKIKVTEDNENITNEEKIIEAAEKAASDSTLSRKNIKKIPEELRNFFDNNYPVFVGGNGEPKEFSSLGDGFKGERNVTQEDIDNFSKETILYLVSFKNPDFILKNFRSGNINFYQF